MGAKVSLHVRGDSAIELTSDAVVIGGEGGTTDYNLLSNKPSIEGNVLIGDKTLDELGITAERLDITAESLGITPEEIGLDSADEYDIYNLFHS